MGTLKATITLIYNIVPQHSTPINLPTLENRGLFMNINH